VLRSNGISETFVYFRKICVNVARWPTLCISFSVKLVFTLRTPLLLQIRGRRAARTREAAAGCGRDPGAAAAAAAMASRRECAPC
jgi:hypothetical protein